MSSGTEPASLFLDTLLLSQQIQHVGTGRKHPGPEAARRFRRQVSPEFHKDSLSGGLTQSYRCGTLRATQNPPGILRGTGSRKVPEFCVEDGDERPCHPRGHLGFKLRSSQVLAFCNAIAGDPLSIRLSCHCHQIHLCPLPHHSWDSCPQACR